MSDTPRTDAAQFSANDASNIMCVRADLARSLERELSAAKAALAEAQTDAVYGKILMRFIDRLNDPVPEDSVEKIVREMDAEVCKELDALKGKQ